VRFLLNLVLMAVIAAAVGLGLTARAVQHPPKLDAIRSGSWTAIASEGTSQIDAYALAAIAHRGEIPLAVSDGLSFRATVDDDGTELSGDCTYSLRGTIPVVRAWSLAAYDAAGAPFANPAKRYGISSGEVAREPDGAVSLIVSPSVHPGNWLPVARGSAVTLTLRLYDTTAGAIAGGRSAPVLLSVKRLGCAS
jgi:hypothetical protein